MSPLLYPNVTVLSSLPSNKTFASSTSSTSRMVSRSTSTVSTATVASYETNSTTNGTSNFTLPRDIPTLIVSIRTPTSNAFSKRFHWKNIWVFVVPILCGIVLCLIVALLGYVKYRRKDVGVYEVDEAQRFRPLIVQLTPSPGEQQQDPLHSTTTTSLPASSTMATTSKSDPPKSHKKRRRKKSPWPSTDEQREFYI